VPLFRREKLHQRLAREGGLAGAPEPLDLSPPVPGVPGYHGVQRPRRWDAVVMVEAPGIEGDEATFVVLAGGSVLLDEGFEEETLEPIAAELDAAVDPPYRVEAVRRQDDVWAAAARRIEIVELPDRDGEELTLTYHAGSRTLEVDGKPEFGSVPELERVAAERFDSYVARASRLDDDLWEVSITPL
jgi:hypothetical protein